jgi:hypothetical protein
MDETAGLGSGTADVTTFDDGACGFGPWPTNGPVDYDGNGDTTETSVSADLNRQDHENVTLCPTGVTEVLTGHAEWGPAACHSTDQACCGATPCRGGGGQSVFAYGFQCTPMFADGVSPPSSLAGSELTADQAAGAHVLLHPLAVSVVVRFGCSTPWIAPRSPDEVPVTIRGAPDLDVAQIDPRALRFAGAPPASHRVSDVDHDGRPDLTASFVQSALRLGAGASTATLTGSLRSSQMLVGNAGVAVRAGPRAR